MIKLGSFFRKQIVDRLKKDITKAESLFVVQYSKLSSPKMTSLRASLKSGKSRLLVTKNSLINRALKESNIDGLESFLEGPSALVIGYDDVAAVSRILAKFSKENESLVLKGGFFKGAILSKKDIETISNLPPRLELIAQVVGALKSPLAGLVWTLKGPLNKLAIVLNQIKEQKTIKGQ